VPIENQFGEITGYYPLMPENCEILDFQGEPYLRYTFLSGQRAVIELSKVGFLTQYQCKDDFFGESNAVLRPTLRLMHTQDEGIINGVKSSASIRFLGRIAQVIKDKDLKDIKERFTNENLSSENASGVMLYDAKIADMQPIESKPFIADPSQMQLIRDSVYTYFGTNEQILQNRYDENVWSAYYEGKIEPFAIDLSIAMSNMTYTSKEIAFGNSIKFTANQLQYASNTTKLQISTQLFDRGLLNRNEIMDIWNMAHVEDGEKYYIRREYVDVDELSKIGKEVGHEASASKAVDGGGYSTSSDDSGNNGEKI
jgi:hypothetical protein